MSDVGLRAWGCANDKFEPKKPGFRRKEFPCCACKYHGKTDKDEPCRSCGHSLTCMLDKLLPNVAKTK